MNESDSPLQTLSAIAETLGRIIIEIAKAIDEWVEELPEKHRRAAQLQAYRLRKKWRKADAAKLRELGMCPPADRRLRRIESAEGRKAAGRGVVSPYVPPEVAFNNFATLTIEFFDANTLPRRRVAILKKVPWWPYVVEALYRGEYAIYKASQGRSPAEAAEQKVALHLGISSATLRKLCAEVRREREIGMTDCPPLLLDDFKIWEETGAGIWPEARKMQCSAPAPLIIDHQPNLKRFA